MQSSHVRLGKRRTTSVPKLTPLNSCMTETFGTCTTKIADFRFAMGPGCRSWFSNKINFIKKLSLFIKLRPPKGPFQGHRGSRSCAEQRQTCIGGDAWVSGGSIVHTCRPWYFPSCGRKCDAVKKKRQNGQTARELLCGGAI